MLSELSTEYFVSRFFFLTIKYNPNKGFFILIKSLISIGFAFNSSLFFVCFFLSITQNELFSTCSYKSSLKGTPLTSIDENKFTLSFILSLKPLYCIYF